MGYRIIILAFTFLQINILNNKINTWSISMSMQMSQRTRVRYESDYIFSRLKLNIDILNDIIRPTHFYITMSYLPIPCMVYDLFI